MSRLIALNFAYCFDSQLPPFVEFKGFDSYLQKFGLDVRSQVLVWRVNDLLNPNGSVDFHLVARPAGWISSMVRYWSCRLDAFLANEV